MIPEMQMNFCRRCGSALHQEAHSAYRCEQGHSVYANASPATAAIICNDKGEVLVIERAIDPGKGLLDAPGGFCDGAETAEDALARELVEEVGLNPTDYAKPVILFTAIDWYEFKGERVPVLSVMFKTTLKPDAVPVAADDAASAWFVPILDVDLKKVYFDAVRAGFAQVQQEYTAKKAKH